MDTIILPIRLGVTTCYVVRQKGTILIDCGDSGRIGKFTRALRRQGISPRDIRLIVATHNHFDHVGSAREIKELTGAPLAAHEADRDGVENELFSFPTPTTAWARMMGPVLRRTGFAFRYSGAHVDILVGDGGLSLKDHGIEGRIMHTPGHTAGSLSVILESGEAFVGDIAMNGLPFRLRPGYPIFTEELEEVRRSWRKLLTEPVTTIYPAHMKKFPAAVLAEILSRPEVR